MNALVSNTRSIQDRVARRIATVLVRDGESILDVPDTLTRLTPERYGDWTADRVGGVLLGEAQESSHLLGLNWLGVEAAVIAGDRATAASFGLSDNELSALASVYAP